MTRGARIAIWLTAAALVVAGASFALYRITQKRPPRYVTQAVTRGDITQVVSATGTLQPLLVSPVGAQVSGIVWKLHADYNDKVKKGQVLLELDPALFRSQVMREEANLLAAQADVQKAAAELADATRIAERAEQLAEKRYIALQERDSAVAKKNTAAAALEAARAREKLARAALDRVRLDLRNSVILSPVDGVVIARSVELGQAVVASFQAPNLFTIAEDLTRMQVLANVDETDIGALHTGQEAEFTVDAFRGRRFHAKVAQIRNAAQTVQNVVTYVVVLNVDNKDLLLRPGMTANVRVVTARREGVLLAPAAALRFRPPLSGRPEGKKADPARGPKERRRRARDGEGVPGTVYVEEAGRLREVPVATGISDGTQTEILAGLSEGQEVVIDLERPPVKGGGAGGAPGGSRGAMRRGGF